jgi:hypothetical protein
MTNFCNLLLESCDFFYKPYIRYSPFCVTPFLMLIGEGDNDNENSSYLESESLERMNEAHLLLFVHKYLLAYKTTKKEQCYKTVEYWPP